MNSGANQEFSIAAVSRELRNEVCGLARVDEFRGFAPASELAQSSKRLLIKSVFSYIEALTHILKAQALEKNDQSIVSIGERLIATEQSFELNDNGTVGVRRAKLRTLSNVRFAFMFYAKAHRCEFRLDVSSNGWQCLQRSLKVRDRLTHPKRLSDLNVLEDEYEDNCRAFIWFERQIMRVLEAAAKALDTKLALLKGEKAPEENSIAHLRPKYVDDDV